MALIEARFGTAFTSEQIDQTTISWMKSAKEHKFRAVPDTSLEGFLAEIYFLSGDNPELATTLCKKIEQVLKSADFTVRILGNQLDLEYHQGELR